MLPHELKRAIREARQRIGRAISGGAQDEVSVRWLRERDTARDAGDTLARAMLDIYTSVDSAKPSVLDAVSRYAETEHNFVITRDVERLRTNKK